MANSKSRKSSSYNIVTSQDMDALNRAAAEGKFGRNLFENEISEEVWHVVPGSTHSVKIPANEEMSFEAIQALVGSQDADTIMAIHYIVTLLAPPGKKLSGPAQGIVEFDNIIKMIGWKPQNPEQKRVCHQRIHSILQFGEQAVVVGKRTGSYYDTDKKKAIDTQIEASLWRIHRVEYPEQGTLFDTVPVRAEVIIASQWVEMLTSKDTAQYLPYGEVLGRIPSARPAAAWARVMGHVLAIKWRSEPVKTLDRSLKISRRDLIDRYPPETGTVDSLLESTNPIRAVKYWCGALEILVDAGFLARTDEADIPYKAMLEKMPRKGWAPDWIESKVVLYPGPAMEEAVRERAEALPKFKQGKK